MGLLGELWNLALFNRFDEEISWLSLMFAVIDVYFWVLTF